MRCGSSGTFPWPPLFSSHLEMEGVGGWLRSCTKGDKRARKKKGGKNVVGDEGMSLAKCFGCLDGMVLAWGFSPERETGIRVYGLGSLIYMG